jgi:hypothetical protein
MLEGDPFPLNCPHCRRKLRYLSETTEGFWLNVFVVHGWFVIGADGRLQRMPERPTRAH